MTIPDIDDTTMRIEAINAAITLDNKDVFELIGNADIILEFIDPLSALNIPIAITLAKQP
jgi:hypothetical protein